MYISQAKSIFGTVRNGEVFLQLHHFTTIKYLKATRVAKFSKQYTFLCLSNETRHVSKAQLPETDSPSYFKLSLK